MKLLPASARYLRLALLVLSGLFLISLGVEFSRDYGPKQDVPAEPSVGDDATTPAAAGPEPVHSLPPIEEFDVIIERPLFSLERRPYVPSINVEAAPPPALENPFSNGQYRLSAVIISEDRRLALLQKQSDNKLYKLGVGENIDGWTIKDIQNKSVSFNRGGETHDLEMAIKPSSASAPRAVPQRRPRTTRTRNAGATPSASSPPVPQSPAAGNGGNKVAPQPPVNVPRQILQPGPPSGPQPIPEQAEAQQRANQAPSQPPAVAQ